MKNYLKVLNNGTLTNSMKNTLIYAVVTVLLSNVVGLAVAMILNTKIHFKGLFRTCAYFPALFSAIVVGFIWSYVYMPGSGMIASLLSMFGMEQRSTRLVIIRLRFMRSRSLKHGKHLVLP